MQNSKKKKMIKIIMGKEPNQELSCIKLIMKSSISSELIIQEKPFVIQMISMRVSIKQNHYQIILLKMLKKIKREVFKL